MRGYQSSFDVGDTKGKLTAKLDAKSLKRLAGAILYRFGEDVEKCGELVTRLAEDGAEAARERFYGDVAVSSAKAKQSGMYKMKASFSARGKEAVFQEFGAGINLGEVGEAPDTEFGRQAEDALGIEIRRGAYSDAAQGEYQATGYEYWYHDGEKYTGVVPMHGMEIGEETVIGNVKARAREVFGGD